MTAVESASINRPDQWLAWWRAGEEFLVTALARLTDEELPGPSLLPGWSRQRLLAHLARNADALVNLLTWARTGVETPMYPSVDARDADITTTAALPAALLRADLLAAASRLVEAADAFPDHAWSAPVRTAQGRTVSAAEIPWMRSREVWVHAVDLDVGVGFADIPDTVDAALIDDVFAMWQRRDTVPDITVRDADRRWGIGSFTAVGEISMLAGWVTGRTTGTGITAAGPLPLLPSWL